MARDHQACIDAMPCIDATKLLQLLQQKYCCSLAAAPADVAGPETLHTCLFSCGLLHVAPCILADQAVLFAYVALAALPLLLMMLLMMLLLLLLLLLLLQGDQAQRGLPICVAPADVLHPQQAAVCRVQGGEGPEG
jgi:hypothetical protein